LRENAITRNINDSRSIQSGASANFRNPPIRVVQALSFADAPAGFYLRRDRRRGNVGFVLAPSCWSARAGFCGNSISG
jgi:hypothetical protein